MCELEIDFQRKIKLKYKFNQTSKIFELVVTFLPALTAVFTPVCTPDLIELNSEVNSFFIISLLSSLLVTKSKRGTSSVLLFTDDLDAI